MVSFVEKLLKWGANAVIASHPHVVQPLELRIPTSGDAPPALVAWSMGNFISNQRPAPRDMGVIARLTLVKSGDVTRIVSADAIPTWVQVRTAQGARTSRVLPLTSALKKPGAFQISAADLKRLNEAHRDFTSRVLGAPVPLKNAKTAYALTASSADRYSTAQFELREKRRREALSADRRPASGKKPLRRHPAPRRKRTIEKIHKEEL